ncbi:MULTISPECIES: hypothetical protein [unclassified Pseudoclavibacter]|nr:MULTISPECIES: hypothetical protein [unclassified Pseudoclavibacter]MBF4549739.1 hypothetical protein [Pseudoclavibacter sp. VKM Ac-2888]PPF39759.1 hypothetical protein C5E05_00650 [Pseudoclavibacter sp. AY1H1]PPF76163.1 hypothetical protein C5B99_09970 [Pseudoclavibacter sp. Z016]PPG03059.1 hypothetical protein C5E06_11580 [Pseudoclavibacter sp. RFBI5]
MIRRWLPYLLVAIVFIVSVIFIFDRLDPPFNVLVSVFIILPLAILVRYVTQRLRPRDVIEETEEV